MKTKIRTWKILLFGVGMIWISLPVVGQRVKNFNIHLTYRGAYVSTVEVNILRILKSDGKHIDFRMEEMPKLVFVDGSIAIKSSSFTATIPIEEFAGYTFVKVSEAENADAPKVGYEVSISDDGALISLCSLGDHISADVYTSNGTLLQTLSGKKGGSLTVSLQNEPAGIYIIKINGTTFKISKR